MADMPGPEQFPAGQNKNGRLVRYFAAKRVNLKRMIALFSAKNCIADLGRPAFPRLSHVIHCITYGTPLLVVGYPCGRSYFKPMHYR